MDIFRMTFRNVELFEDIRTVRDVKIFFAEQMECVYVQGEGGGLTRRAPLIKKLRYTKEAWDLWRRIGRLGEVRGMPEGEGGRIPLEKLPKDIEAEADISTMEVAGFVSEIDSIITRHNDYISAVASFRRQEKQRVA